VDAYLWIKTPGGSDGDCHAGDPPAGGWFQSYALGLVQRAVDNKIIDYRPTGQ
jgi:endoglucanase